MLDFQFLVASQSGEILLDLATVRERYLLGACSDPVCAVRYAPLRSGAGEEQRTGMCSGTRIQRLKRRWWMSRCCAQRGTLGLLRNIRVAQRRDTGPHQPQNHCFPENNSDNDAVCIRTEKQRSIKREAFLSTIRNLI